MKKLLTAIVLIVIVLWGSSLAGDHYRHELYDWAINYETDKAGLVSISSIINQQAFFYLERKPEANSETVVLLHGFSADKSNWLRFVQALPANFHVMALDLMGHGAHHIDLDKHYGIEQQVDYLQSFLESHVQQPVHLVGNSMGGAIASLYASRFPERVRSLMLISPAGVHDVPSEMDKQLNNNHNPLIASSLDGFYEVVDFVMEEPPFIPQALLKVQAEKAVARYELNQKIFADIRQDMHRNLGSAFADIKAPTLILWGQQDRVIHPANIERYASLIPSASARLLEGIGHLAMLEVPQLSANAFVSLSTSTRQTGN
jgi:pimeloyl-ACP methyl ester carboxylesterase